MVTWLAGLAHAPGTSATHRGPPAASSAHHTQVPFGKPIVAAKHTMQPPPCCSTTCKQRSLTRTCDWIHRLSATRSSPSTEPSYQALRSHRSRSRLLCDSRLNHSSPASRWLLTDSRVGVAPTVEQRPWELWQPFVRIVTRLAGKPARLGRGEAVGN